MTIVYPKFNLILWSFRFMKSISHFFYHFYNILSHFLTLLTNLTKKNIKRQLMPAPSTDLNCTIERDGFEGFVNASDVPAEIKETVIRNKIPLDCMWRIQVQEKWKVSSEILYYNSTFCVCV